MANTVLFTNPYVVNLSSYTLSDIEIRVLEKGLSFIPSINKVCTSDINKQISAINRRILLKDYFHNRVGGDKPYDPKLFQNMFIPPSLWIPPFSSISRTTIQQLNKTGKDIKELTDKHRKGNYLHFYSPHNLSLEERKTITTLKTNTSITIKSADKGGAIVIMDSDKYILEARRQLNDGKYYLPIPESIANKNRAIINNIIHKMNKEGYLNHKQCLFFTSNSSIKSRTFYLLPKIHKSINTWPFSNMPSGRPIVSCCNTELHSVGKLIDYYLQPICQQQYSYTKDTIHFISKIRNKQILPTHYLVTGDITSLYTNMDHGLIMSSIQSFFSKFPDKNRPDKYILELLHLTITGNDFVFNGQFYLQVLGMAMGNPCSPATANLFMEEFDQSALQYFIHILCYNRFLDDTFFVWPATVPQLLQFQTYLNGILPNITITFNYSLDSVDFLDVTVFKHTMDGNTTLQTKPYFKATDTHQLIEKSSYHPKHVFEGIIKSQFLRLKRLSSFQIDYMEASNILIEALRKRKYSKRMLRYYKNYIWFNHQTNNYKINNNKSSNILPLVLNYNPLGIQLSSIYKRNFKNNPAFENTAFISAYRINKNINRLLQ